MKFMTSFKAVLLGLAIAAATLWSAALRSQLPSQCVWPMRMGRSKSKLVPKNYGTSRRLRGPWSVALLQVIAFGAARGVRRGTCASPVRVMFVCNWRFSSRDVRVRWADAHPDVVLRLGVN